MSFLFYRSESYDPELSASTTGPTTSKPVTSTKQVLPPSKRATEHVTLATYHKPVKQIIIESAALCCKKLINLKLECLEEQSVHGATPMHIVPIQRNINVMVAILGGQISIETTKLRNIETVLFEDECDYISKLLAIEDKLIYAIIPATLGDFVAPLIHNHKCIEYVYIYQDTAEIEPLDWIADYSKIQERLYSTDEVTEIVQKEIESIMPHPSRWPRSKQFLTELCLQRTEPPISMPIEDVQENDLQTYRIVVLHLNERQSFHLSHPTMKITEFDNIHQCIDSIKNDNCIPVFLLIATNTLDSIQSIVELNPIQAIYIVTNVKFDNDEVQRMSIYSKLNGIFNPDEDFLEQLTTDMCFYHRIRIRTPTVSVFKLEPNILDKLNKHQVDFLCFQLFSTILPQLSSQLTTASGNDLSNRDQLFSQLIEANLKISHLFQNFNPSALKESVIQLNEINRNIVSLAKNVDSSSATVYRAQLVTEEDLKMIQTNSSALLTIQTFVLASRSFRSAVKICRQAVDNQLTVVLFELKLSERATVTDLDPETVVFSLGTLFRLVSADAAPDGIWRARLESTDGTMQRINDQLRLEMGGHLTWLTFGNYLSAFKGFNEAKNYYEYLLLVLPSDHPSLASINNNMGLIYSQTSEDTEALTFFNKASELRALNSSMEVEEKSSSTTGVSLPPSSTIDNITILNKIAEISSRQEDKKTALEYYRRALHLAADAATYQFYQRKIDEIISSDKN